MKKWYQSKLIGVGFIAVLTAVVAALSTEWNWEKAALAGLGALVIVLRKYFTDTGLISVLCFVMVIPTVTGCGNIDLPDSMTSEQVQMGVCAGMAMDNCLNSSMDAIGIRQATCEEDIEALINGDISLDSGKLSNTRSVCQNYVISVLRYIDRIKEVAKKAQGS